MQTPQGVQEWILRLATARAPSARAVANVDLLQKIQAIHTMSDATYGMPRIRAELLDAGVVASKNRIARLMRLAHLQGVSRRRGTR